DFCPVWPPRITGRTAGCGLADRDTGEGAGLEGRPQRAIRTAGDAVRLGPGGGQVVLVDAAIDGDPADPVAAPLGEPQVAVDAGGDGVGAARRGPAARTRRWRRRGDAPDLAGGRVGDDVLLDRYHEDRSNPLSMAMRSISAGVPAMIV